MGNEDDRSTAAAKPSSPSVSSSGTAYRRSPPSHKRQSSRDSAALRGSRIHGQQTPPQPQSPPPSTQRMIPRLKSVIVALAFSCAFYTYVASTMLRIEPPFVPASLDPPPSSSRGDDRRPASRPAIPNGRSFGNDDEEMIPRDPTANHNNNHNNNNNSTEQSVPPEAPSARLDSASVAPRVVVWNTTIPSRPRRPSTIETTGGWGRVARPGGTIGEDENDDEPGEPAPDAPGDDEPPNDAHTNGTAVGATGSGHDENDEGDAPVGDEEEDRGGDPETPEDFCRKDTESWQSASYPNCNTLHELDLDPTHSQTLRFLGQGWFRSTWRLDRETGNNGRHDEGESVVVKMLRLEREFLDEYYELHRRDAVAMEQLTFSPFVMNVYGYCGQSAINELAEFRDGVNSLEQLNRGMRGREGPQVLFLKLRLALSVAVGLYHVHYGRPGLPWEEETTNDANPANATRRRRPTMAHYDMNPRNIAMVESGKPKLNDFNIAEFLRYPTPGADATNTTTGAVELVNERTRTCGFPARLHEPWWRAPEEMDLSKENLRLVDEKVDIYALGNVLYHILTTHAPRGKMKKERMPEVRDVVRQGVRPKLDEPWASRTEPAVVAFRDAMDLCFHPDPSERGTSAEVATILYRAVDATEELARREGEGKAKPSAKPQKKPKKR